MEAQWAEERLQTPVVSLFAGSREFGVFLLQITQFGYPWVLATRRGAIELTVAPVNEFHWLVASVHIRAGL